MSDLKAKRLAAGISGCLLCVKVGVSRSRLSLIERGYTMPTPQELARIDAALDQLIRDKAVIQRAAASVGWPLGGWHD